MNNPRKNYCLEVWSDFGCFSRAELKVERVSYDVIPPSAARAVFSAIFWKPAIRWHVTAIEVLSPIEFTSIRRNEVAALASKGKDVFIEETRQQKAGIILRNPRYRLFADLEYLPPEERETDTPRPEEGPERPQKYFSIFERRAVKGQSFMTPYMGCREFSAYFRYIPETELAEERKLHPALDAAYDRDFGLMLFDMDFQNNPPTAMFYRPVMKNGVIPVPEADSLEVLR